MNTASMGYNLNVNVFAQKQRGPSNAMLIIDDDQDFINFFKTLCAKHGIRKKIFEANDPREGLDIFISNYDQIQIVVCDFLLPVQNGTDLLEILKQNKPGLFCCLLSANESVIKNKYPYIDKTIVKNNLLSHINLLKLD